MHELEIEHTRAYVSERGTYEGADNSDLCSVCVCVCACLCVCVCEEVRERQ
jgi:hypothetical protein